MPSIPLGISDNQRRVAKEARIALRNRYFEKNPVLNQDQVALIARPGRRKYLDVGIGPIRAVYEAPGAFGKRLFVVSENNLYTVDPDTDAVVNLGQISTSTTGSPSMAATAPIGDSVPAYLFIAEGTVLWCYADKGPSRGHLLASSIANNDTVTIGTVVYKFTSGSVNAGTPAGTALNPWLVQLGGSVAISIDNLAHAINDTGVPSALVYSSALVPHPAAQAYSWSGGNLYIRATAGGPTGAVATTETGASMAWDNPTTIGHDTPLLFQIELPDSLGAISVAHINSYIVVVPTQNESDNAVGRFYWIVPGETIIDPLDYATAERSPDPILQALVFSDKLWLTNAQTTEVWIPSGDPAAPFQRLSGVLFDRGSWEGTATVVKDNMIVVDSDGAVFQISGGIKRISTPDVEERIRKAIEDFEAS